MSEEQGQYGFFASHALHQVLDAPTGFVRFLASPLDQPDSLRVLTHLSPELAGDLERVLYVSETAAREARLRSDAVIPVIELGEHDGLPYLIRPYLGGVDADALVGRRAADPARLPPAVGATIVHGVIQGLSEAQEAGLMHLGLRPADVIVDQHGDVSITGFTEGTVLAKFWHAPSRPKDLAPELRREEPEGGPQSDVYAVGLLLYRLLTGKPQPDEWEPRWAGIMMELSAAGVPGDALMLVVDFLQRSLAERCAQRYADVIRMGRAFGPLRVELDAPKPRQIVARAVAGLMPAPPNTRPVVLEGTHPGSGVQPASGFPHDRPRSGVSELPPSPSGVTASVSGVSSASGPRETRVMASSRPGLRSLSPELRDRIGPHQLEILARSRYQVLGELGSGGTGTVYKVLDTTLSEVLALKVLSAELTRDSAWLQRFKRELKITRDLEHPHILPAYHLEHLEGMYFFTMRFVDGETLYQRIARRGALPMGEGQRILLAVGEALAAAHDKGIVHRDFKSANVMLERVTELPFLMDFGIAYAPDNAGLTMTGQGIGTPMYMAPEQAAGQSITARADVYAYGVVLYEVFSGELPFRGTTTVAVYQAQMSGQYAPLRQLSPSHPEALAKLVDDCLQPAAKDRPASMRDVLARLKGVEHP